MAGLIPFDSVRVGAVTYTVALDEAMGANENLNGDIVYSAQRIRLSSLLGPQQLRVTFLHELLHACQNSLGRQQNELHVAEHWIEGMADVLLDTLARNPVMAAWLIEGADNATVSPPAG